MSNVHVFLEQKICVVTGKPYETESVLLDKRIRKNPSTEKYRITGYGVSPEEQKKLDKGYIILIGCDPEKTVMESNGRITPENAHRTGEILYLKRVLADQIFDVQVKDIAFVDEQVVMYLRDAFGDKVTNI